VTTRRKGVDLDPDEPRNVAEAIAEMELDYVVVTSVDRDDLEDGGAGHFAACIRETRLASPKTMVEVLVPDFSGHIGQILTVVEAEPDVIAHNVETVERLTPKVRDPRAGYRQSLDVLQAIKTIDPKRFTKSSIMVGVGETEAEVIETMRHLREVGCDFLTVGQYLQPTKKHLKIDSYVPPEQFEAYQAVGLDMGFAYVASGPLVRSSYKAGEFFIRDYLQKQKSSQSA
jgi:lipoic acid synthetase